MERLLLDTERAVKLETSRELRHLLEQVLHTTVPDQSLSRKIQLCLSESITNLVLHSEPRATRIVMRFGSDSCGWWLDILDDGGPWDPTKHNRSELISEFCEAEGGRGVALIHDQCDHLDYQPASDAELNRLRLIWNSPEQSRGPKILIVEDDAPLRRLYEIYLSGVFEVTTAASGREALLELKKEKFDLVLSDICMPQMDGMALREKLIEDSGSRLIPFVFLTAMNDADHLERASSLGIDDYLVKPANKAQLIRTIQRVLQRSRQIYQQLTDRIDRGITSAMAPSLPEVVNGWRLGVASRHTGSGGGDLLLHQSGEDKFQLVLADIMGHDDGAKFFAHACGGYLRGLMHAMGTDGDPAQLLEQLSDYAMQDRLMSKITLTCCSVALSPGGEITLASAGHLPPLRISPTGVEALSIGGILPGLLPATRYQSSKLKIACGERIALYTDGLFESAANEVLRRQLEERITSALADTLDAPIDRALRQVMTVFDQLAGTPPKDDVLLLLMEPVES